MAAALHRVAGVVGHFVVGADLFAARATRLLGDGDFAGQHRAAQRREAARRREPGQSRFRCAERGRGAQTGNATRNRQNRGRVCGRRSELAARPKSGHRAVCIGGCRLDSQHRFGDGDGEITRRLRRARRWPTRFASPTSSRARKTIAPKSRPPRSRRSASCRRSRTISAMRAPRSRITKPKAASPTAPSSPKTSARLWTVCRPNCAKPRPNAPPPPRL